MNRVQPVHTTRTPRTTHPIGVHPVPENQVSWHQDVFLMFNDNPKFRNNNLFKRYPGDAGWDIRANEDVLIPPQTSALVSTGLHVFIPFGLQMPLKTKSRFAKRKVEIGNALIDHGFTGAIIVPVYNHHCNEPLRLSEGEYFAQAVFEPAFTRPLSEMLGIVAPMVFPEAPVAEWPIPKITEQARGDQGFGHTKDFEPGVAGGAGLAGVRSHS